MNRISSSSFLIFGFIFAFVFFTLTDISLAQEENTFLPTAPGTTDTGDGTNIFLQRDSAPAQAAQKNSPANEIPPTGTTLACPYKFTRDLELGMSGEDVRLMQVLLNTDTRTVIAKSGAGSPGKETGSYGESTKAAVAKFQETFKEYVGTVNGRFGPRTRTVMNQICSGKTTKSEGVNFNKIQTNQISADETQTSNDKIAPRVTLAANFNSIQTGNTFKIIVNLSEPIKAFTPDSVIVDNGEVKEIRKLSKNSYAMTMTPKEGAKTVNVQIEAEKIEDMSGNLNENASNEVLVKILATPTNNPTNNSVTPDSVDSLINKITSSVPDCRYDGSGDLITTNPITGEKLNANGCKMKDPNKQYAAFNTTLKCYADNGELPAGIQETQRCSNPQNPNSPNNPLNPNNPNSPCSAYNQQQYAYQVQQAQIQQQQQSMYGGFSFGNVLPPNPCQNAQVVQATQQKMQQQRQQAQQAAQQKSQFEGLGQMLGNLLKSGGLGGGNNSQNNFGQGPYKPWDGVDKEVKEEKSAEEKKVAEITGEKKENDCSSEFKGILSVVKGCDKAVGITPPNNLFDITNSEKKEGDEVKKTGDENGGASEISFTEGYTDCKAVKKNIKDNSITGLWDYEIKREQWLGGAGAAYDIALVTKSLDKKIPTGSYILLPSATYIENSDEDPWDEIHTIENPCIIFKKSKKVSNSFRCKYMAYGKDVVSPIYEVNNYSVSTCKQTSTEKSTNSSSNGTTNEKENKQVRDGIEKAKESASDGINSDGTQIQGKKEELKNPNLFRG